MIKTRASLEPRWGILTQLLLHIPAAVDQQNLSPSAIHGHHPTLHWVRSPGIVEVIWTDCPCHHHEDFHGSEHLSRHCQRAKVAILG
jgi:hypothetical protein